MKPWHVFLRNLAELFNVKTIVELAIVFIFCIQVIRGAEISGEIMLLVGGSFVDCLHTGAKAAKKWRKARKEDAA